MAKTRRVRIERRAIEGVKFCVSSATANGFYNYWMGDERKSLSLHPCKVLPTPASWVPRRTTTGWYDLVTTHPAMRTHARKRAWLLRSAIVGLVAAGCSSPQVSVAQVDTALTLPPSESVAQGALNSLISGHPWAATRTLAPLLADSSRRTPGVVLVAAAAAARIGGWNRVAELLGHEVWVDTAFEGRGVELLARAALERVNDSLALVLAERAVRAARAAPIRGVRLVLLARALDRAGSGDSASASYAAAAEVLPDVRDWLLLRAAGASRDGGRRRGFYRDVTGAVARERVPVSDAFANARWGAPEAAARTFDSLGMSGRALRSRLDAVRDSAGRAAVRPAAFALLQRDGRPTDVVRDVIDVIDRTFAPLSASEELSAARAAAAAGASQRAAAGFSRAEKGGASLGSRDRLTWAQALVRTGAVRDAAAQFARVPAGDSLRAEAAYGRARALLRAGSRTAAREALREVATHHPRDTASASGALFLLADLATDDGRDDAARDGYRSLAARYPTSTHAPAALLRAGVIAFANRQDRAAMEAFDAIERGFAKSTEALAARYWSGRAAARLGNRAEAAQRWRDVLQREPVSYYAMLSAKRLGEPWRFPLAPDSGVADDSAMRALRRADALGALGMEVERDLELSALSDAARSPDRRYAIATALVRGGRPWLAVRIARQALNAGAPRDAQLVRLLHPLAYGELIARESKAKKLDPALVAALILQESSFNPTATSVAGAMGLMQVLPDVGRALANRRRYPVWDRSLLHEAEVSVELGTTHLAAMLGGYPHLAYALAAYNAGGSPVGRWRTKTGTEDPELFVERIPYDETRDYVRILSRDRDVYARLYTW
jgi:soluble lytic murein transglycosylase